MRFPLAILVIVSAQTAHASCSERELYDKQARFVAQFNATHRDVASSAAAIRRIEGVMQAYERDLPAAARGSLRAACGEFDAMAAAIGR